MNLQSIQDIINSEDEPRKVSKDGLKMANQISQFFFICALSEKKIYGILGVEGSITSDIIKHYITELVLNRKWDPDMSSSLFVIIWDNAKMYSNKLIEDFLVKSKLRAISIPQNIPVLNPWEKLINSIKVKIKIMHSKVR